MLNRVINNTKVGIAILVLLILASIVGFVANQYPSGVERFSVTFEENGKPGIPVSVGIYLGRLPTYWDKWTNSPVWQEWLKNNP
jgi:hypothetical protein